MGLDRRVPRRCPPTRHRATLGRWSGSAGRRDGGAKTGRRAPPGADKWAIGRRSARPPGRASPMPPYGRRPTRDLVRSGWSLESGSRPTATPAPARNCSSSRIRRSSCSIRSTARGSVSPRSWIAGDGTEAGGDGSAALRGRRHLGVRGLAGASWVKGPREEGRGGALRSREATDSSDGRCRLVRGGGGHGDARPGRLRSGWRRLQCAGGGPMAAGSRSAPRRRTAGGPARLRGRPPARPSSGPGCDRAGRSGRCGIGSAGRPSR